MSYEQLLDQAYDQVEVVEESDRFEIVKVSGHHEGTRTILTNFGTIAAHIRRDPKHLMKFLTKEMAASGELSGERLILSRKVSSKDVNDKICRYVASFVTCAGCGKPDTELGEEGQKIIMKCLACGSKKQVHKL